MDAKIEDAIFRLLQRLDRYAPEKVFEEEIPPLYRHWSPEEDETLKQMWHVRPRQEIADAIGRPLHAVKGRGKRIGLTPGASHAA